MGRLKFRVEQSCVFSFFVVVALGLAHCTQPDCALFQVSIVLYQLQILLLPGIVLSQDQGSG